MFDLKLTYWPMSGKNAAGYAGTQLPETGTVMLSRLLDNKNTYDNYVKVSQAEKDRLPMIQGVGFGSRLIKNPDNGKESGKFLSEHPEFNAYYHWNGFYAVDIDVNKDSAEIITEETIVKLFNTLKTYKWFLSVHRSTGGKGLHIWTYTRVETADLSVQELEFVFKENAKRINKTIEHILSQHSIPGWTDSAMCQIAQGIHFSKFHKYCADLENFTPDSFSCTIPKIIKYSKNIQKKYELKLNKTKSETIIDMFDERVELHHKDIYKLSHEIHRLYTNADDYKEWIMRINTIEWCNSQHNYDKEWNDGAARCNDGMTYPSVITFLREHNFKINAECNPLSTIKKLKYKYYGKRF